MATARPGDPAARQGCPDQVLSGDVSASALGDDAERAAHVIAAARQAFGPAAGRAAVAGFLASESHKHSLQIVELASEYAAGGSRR